MTGVVEGVDEPAEVFLRTAPIEDSGAETADRYEWQAAMASVDALAAYADWIEAGRPPDFEFRLICEWHEDWALVRGNLVEIVSAKHREPQVGAITGFRELLDEGGVLHLLRSWLNLGRSPNCRLVTTSGLDNALAEVKEACRHFCENGVTDDGISARVIVLDKVVRAAKLQDSKLSIDRAMIAAFLGCLQIVEGRPHRTWVPHGAPTGYAGPVANLLGRRGAENAIWRAVLAVVRTRMHAGGPTGREALPVAPGTASGPDVAARVVTLTEIDDAVSIALEHAEDYTPPPRVIDPSNLGIKLAVGQLSDNVSTHAQRLRRRYVTFRDAASDIPGERERFERVEYALMRLVRDAEQVAAPGPALWYEIERRVISVAGTDEFRDMDADSLVGAVAELCQQCMVWFSHRFDVKGKRREIITAGGQV